MTPITTYRAFVDARKTLGPCAAYRVAIGRARPAPLQLLSTPRRRRRLLRTLQGFANTLAFAAVSALSAGLIYAQLPYSH